MPPHAADQTRTGDGGQDCSAISSARPLWHRRWKISRAPLARRSQRAVVQMLLVPPWRVTPCPEMKPAESPGWRVSYPLEPRFIFAVFSL
jgi:hypothetical protein